MSIYALFKQDQVWTDSTGNDHQIDEMSVRYKANVVRFIERRAQVLGMAYSFEEVMFLFADGGPRGEMASAAFEAELADDDHRRAQDPVGWIRDTKLMRRLISDVEQGLGGVDD